MTCLSWSSERLSCFSSVAAAALAGWMELLVVGANVQAAAAAAMEERTKVDLETWAGTFVDGVFVIFWRGGKTRKCASARLTPGTAAYY